MPPKEKPRRLGRPRGGSDLIVQSVLDAALKQLGDRGYAALSVEEIARAAGVNKTSVYRRWPSKAALVLAAVRVLRDSAPPPPASGDLRADLIEVLRSKAALVTTPRGRKIARALIAFEDAELARVSRALRKNRYAVPGAVIQGAIERGELARGTDPELLSELLLAPLYYRLIFLNEPIDGKFVERVVDQVLLGARPGKKQL